MLAKLPRLGHFALGLGLLLLLASAAPGDPFEVVFCPSTGDLLTERIWSPSPDALLAGRADDAELALVDTLLEKKGSNQLQCTYRLEGTELAARFHLRLSMPDNYSCTRSGFGAFVCRVKR